MMSMSAIERESEYENDGTSQLSDTDEENGDCSLDFNFTWKIQNFLLCFHKNGEVLESPIINEEWFDGNWVVELYPKGITKKEEGFISLYLRKENDDKHYKSNDVTFFASIVNENGVSITSGRRRKLLQNNKGERLGWRKFMEIKKLIEATENCEDDILKIQCSMRCKRLPRRSHTPEPEAYTEVGVNRNTFLWNVEIPEAYQDCTTEFALSESLLLGIFVFWSNGEFQIRMYQKQKGSLISKLIKCKVSLKGAKGNIVNSETAYHFFEGKDENEVWDFPCFITSMTIFINRSSFVQMNMLTLCFEFSVSTGTVASKVIGDSETNEDPCLVLQEDIKNMYLNRIHSDVKLNARNEIVYAHKSVLSARSPVFFTMFNQDMKESRTGIVDISDVDANTLKSFLEFIYTGKVEMKDFGEVKKLLLIANKYQVLSLKEECVSFLKLVLSLLNACEMLIVADMIGHHHLKRVTLDFIAMNSDIIFNTPEWLNLVKKHFKLASEVFSNIGANFSLFPNSSSACNSDSWYQERKKRKRSIFSE